MLEHFERLAVHYLGHAIGNGGNPVMEIDLPRGNVNRLLLAGMEALAP
jgi:hypothetical protein